MADASVPVSEIRRLTWSKGLAPRYIALFLLIAYYDQLAPRTLAVGGLIPSAVGALAAGLICNLLFFRPVALAGLRARQDIEDVGVSVFGPIGAIVFVRLLLAVCQVVWFAVALHYAVETTFRALAAAKLLDARHLLPATWGGRQAPGLMYLWVAAIWSLTSALLGTLAFRLVAAVMAGYQAFPAIALAAAVAWALPAAGAFVPSGVDAVTQQEVSQPAQYAILLMIQLVCGFFATHAALGADWGNASGGVKDVERGGWVGVTFASATLAALGLLIIAGARGRLAIDAATPVVAQPIDGRGFTVGHSLLHGMGGYPAALVLITLSLALMGPVCFTPFMFARLVRPLTPNWPRWVLTIAAAILTWPLLFLRVADRLDLVFTVLGALTAPLAAVIGARALRRRTPTTGRVNLAAALAWVMGVVAGLAPVLGPALNLPGSENVQPAVVWGYLVAFLVYHIATLAGLDPAGKEPVAASELAAA